VDLVPRRLPASWSGSRVARRGDYSPLGQRLREFGKHVVGIGTEASASPRLVSVCSEYKYWGTLVAAVEPSAKLAVEKTFDINHGEGLLIRAIKQSNTSTPVAAWLKARMMTLDSAFDERNYGCRNFKEFLGRLSEFVVIEGGDESVHLRVRLREPVPEPRVET
jgi:hypothetical protein